MRCKISFDAVSLGVRQCFMAHIKNEKNRTATKHEELISVD